MVKVEAYYLNGGHGGSEELKNEWGRGHVTNPYNFIIGIIMYRFAQNWGAVAPCHPHTPTPSFQTLWRRGNTVALFRQQPSLWCVSAAGKNGGVYDGLYKH